MIINVKALLRNLVVSLLGNPERLSVYLLFGYGSIFLAAILLFG